jgi:alanyl-tRNA synthetase
MGFRLPIAGRPHVFYSMTERLYYHDAYRRDFTARVVRTSADGATAYLDRTAFYPTSGGQPFDTGLIAGIPVLDVADEGELIAHRLAAPLSTADVECSIDWERRFDHMQQHTGQHLLSAVFEELSDLRTVSFHLGQESSTIDLEGGSIESRAMRDVESRANQIVCQNRPITVRFEEAAQALGLRKPSERAGTLRIVSIEGLDRSACGGTHVRATGEIGAILIRKPEKVRQAVRVEFLCGARAVSRARADYEALARVAQLFSAGLDEAPALVEAQWEAGRAADKARRKIQLELAAYHGRELYAATPASPDGLRRYTHRPAQGSPDELAALARSFTAQPKAIFLGAVDKAPSVIYAVSEDAGIDAGQALKQILLEVGGRGGGNARLAQGSVPVAVLDEVVQRLASL